MWKSWILTLAVLIPSGAFATAPDELTHLQKQWAHILYEMTPQSRESALAELISEADQLVAERADRPELLIWQGIILSSYAGEAGGFGALGAAKRARRSLERALELDPVALDGSAYTSLGALYYKVPGWPIGFGSDKKAKEYLTEALRLNPQGIDPNFFMGEFLLEGGDYAAAREYLQKALSAPDRAGREVADAGRRDEIKALLNQLAAR